MDWAVLGMKGALFGAFLPKTSFFRQFANPLFKLRRSSCKFENFKVCTNPELNNPGKNSALRKLTVPFTILFLPSPATLGSMSFL